MNRGSPHCLRPRAQPPRSFNEAPIHESGKLSSGSLRFSATAGFNEAPIHESGKC